VEKLPSRRYNSPNFNKFVATIRYHLEEGHQIIGQQPKGSCQVFLRRTQVIGIGLLGIMLEVTVSMPNREIT